MTCIYRYNRTSFQLIEYFKRLSPAVRKDRYAIVFACLLFLIRNLFGNFDENWYEG